MLAVLSPAKKLDESPATGVFTQPQFLDQSQMLIDLLKSTPRDRIKALMKLSDKLTDLNVARYQAFQTPLTTENAKQAIFAFKGDTYVGLDAETLDAEDIAFAQDRLRILSGLYGLLRPLDLMHPYRLEMGTKLANERGKDLYAFWGDRLTEACNEALAGHASRAVICLASNEYSKAISKQKIAGDFITCHFKEMRDGEPKTIGLFAKKARGMMARYMIKARAERPSELKSFQDGGYTFVPDLSGEQDYVFVR